MNVMVAGVAGASLGTEIVKSLETTKRFNVYVCDISPLAYGHYMDSVKQSFVLEREGYIENLLKLCKELDVSLLIPGGDEPSVLIGANKQLFVADGIEVATNTPDVISLCSDKAKTFDILQKHGVKIPKTVSVSSLDQLHDAPLPCVVKPATGTGGSNLVFLAADQQSQRIYTSYILESGSKAVIQEYIGVDEGEVTIGVLHTPDGELVGSIALQRMFHAKLSVFTKNEVGIISSGYSQGLIDEFQSIRKQAEDIATLVKSKGPLNIQGRIRDGALLPFEINPRFSATTYLRTLAGFNEVDMYARVLLDGETPPMPNVKYGYYLRSLDETFVPKGGLVS
tara:strand:- start:9732 stop:10748 length:1017 start_codon:yes stop_codon:yes gene_type:complete